jgi:hypothetical protein
MERQNRWKEKMRMRKRRWSRERKEKGLSGKIRRRRKERGGEEGKRAEEEEMGEKDNEKEKMKYWEK